MEKLIVPSVGLGQTFCAAEALSRPWLLWPGAEDGALRGRNLSAVFRTLYRQVGKPQKRLPSCAQTWRVENQCDKSTLRTFQRHRLIRERGPKKPFHPTLKQPLTRQSNCVSIFSGQAQAHTPWVGPTDEKVSPIWSDLVRFGPRYAAAGQKDWFNLV